MQSARAHFIYALLEPDTSELRYVGQTVMTLKERLALHCSSRLKTHTASWIKGLKQRGMRPEIRALRTAYSQADADRLEQMLIAHYRAVGCNLTNHDGGGQGCRIISSETREQMRASRLAVLERDGPRPHTEASKAKLSAAKQGKPIPCLQGHPVSAATREKIAASKRGKPRPPEVREKLRQGSLADHARRRAEKRAETRRKMNEAAMGNKNASGERSAEMCARMSAAKKGKPWSAARRAAYEKLIAAL